MNTPPGQLPAAKARAPIPQSDASALTTLLVVACVAAAFTMLLGGHDDFSALRDWNSGLLTAVSVLALAAMILGLLLFCIDGAPVLGILERLLVAVGTTILVWAALGYSLTYTRGNDFIGGFSKVFLSAVTIDSRVATFTAGFTVSEIGFVIFQGGVAAIASALVVGALGKLMKPAAVALFVPLWATLVFFPIAHMAWYWVGPDAISDAAKALAAASDSAAKAAAQATLDEVITDAGWLFKKGLLDYAGGTVVALVAGTAGLVGLVLRADNPGTDASPNRWPPISGRGALGLALMWLAWFGLNAASNLDFADSATRVAMASCFSATGAAAVAGAAAEWLTRRQASVRGVLYGALAGIVAVSPAAAFSGTVGAVALGLCAGAAAIALMHASDLGAPADLPIIHACGGLIGTLGTGILVNPALGGMGIMDYTTGKIADYDFASQMTAQSWGVAVTLTWAGLGSLILFWIIDLMVGRPPENRPAP